MNQMQGWLNEGDLMPYEKDDFDKKSIKEKWHNYFKTVKRESEKIKKSKLSASEKNEKINEIAQKCIDDVRDIELKIGENEEYQLNTTRSNGQFYYLSDENPKIGWRYDWEEKYKK